VGVSEGSKRLQDNTSFEEKLKSLGKLVEPGGENPIIDKTIADRSMHR
jgi:hypothetical protein